MSLEITRDPDAIIEFVEPLLAADPVRNTVYGSVIAGLREDDADGWFARPAGTTGAHAVRSQRHTPIVVTAGWDDLGPLADALLALAPVAAIGGPVAAVAALATELEARGLVATSRMAERLLRLDELNEPATAAGTARLAAPDDLALLARWYESFLLEVFGGLPVGFDAGRAVERGVQRGGSWLWVDGAAAPCAMAVRHPAEFGVARIGPVYTPLDRRGRGYGSAATAAATRDVLSGGAVPVLYTDVANPTSNKIYQSLGFYPVEDRARVAFS